MGEVVIMLLWTLVTMSSPLKALAEPWQPAVPHETEATRRSPGLTKRTHSHESRSCAPKAISGFPELSPWPALRLDHTASVEAAGAWTWAAARTASWSPETRLKRARRSARSALVISATPRVLRNSLRSGASSSSLRLLTQATPPWQSVQPIADSRS